MQSSLWAEVKALNGWKARRVIAFDGEQIIGGAQMLTRTVKFFGTIGYVPKGPILIGEDKSLATKMLAQIDKLANSEQLRLLFVQPSEFNAWVPELVNRGFKPSPVEIAPSATLLVDLTADLDAILSRMSKGMRNHVRRSQKRGIRVREGSKDDLPIFHRLLSATGQRQRFSIFDLAYFQGMWDILDQSGYIKLFISELDGDAVSAQVCVLFGNTVVAKQIGWSGQHRHLHPNEALDWFTIQWAKRNGYRFYDLEGIERHAAKTLLAGKGLPAECVGTAAAYKSRLGGNVHLSPAAYCYIANPVLRAVYNRVGLRFAKLAVVQQAIGRFRTS